MEFNHHKNRNIGSHSKMEISLLGNAQELEQLNFKMLIELSRLSDIRQEKLLPNINKFLKFSQSSIEKFIEDNVGSFIKERDRALACYGLYVNNYKDLVEKLRSVKKGCETDKDLNCIESSIGKMLSESETQLNVLEQLKKLSHDMVQGKVQFFRVRNYKNEDKYFVLPFVKYMNILLMCSRVCIKEKELSRTEKESGSKMQKIKSIVQKLKDEAVDTLSGKEDGVMDILWGKSEGNEDSDVYEEVEWVADLYKSSLYLMRWYCDGKTDKEWLEKKVLGREADKISCEEIRKEFTNIIAVYYKDYLAREFRPEDYIGISKITELINTCKELEADIQKAQDEHEKIGADQEKIRADQEKIKNDLQEVKVSTHQVKKQMKKTSINVPQVEKLLKDTERNTNTIEQFMTQILKGKAKGQKGVSSEIKIDKVGQIYSKEEKHTQNRGGNINQLIANNDQLEKDNSNQITQPANQAGPSYKLDEVLQPMSCNQCNNDPNVQRTSRSRSSSLLSSGSSNGNQLDPSSRLSEVQSISRSQSLSSVRS